MNNLNELIQSGKLPKECIYYKFVSNTPKYALVDWSRKNDFKWDEDVLEFFKTIKYLGGAATAKFVCGPCHHGTGRGGIKEFNVSNANLGGPSDHALRKVQTGYTPFSCVFEGLLEVFQALELMVLIHYHQSSVPTLFKQ